MRLPSNIISWLLESSDPSIQYRTKTEILDFSLNDNENNQYREAIEKSASVQQILNKMHPDGYWLQQNPRTKKVVGDGVEYGSFATTHFCLAYLAELGLDNKNEIVAKATERYLNLQKSDGDWYEHFSCLYGYNIKTFIKMGYRDDERVKRTIGLLLNSIRYDNGYLCDMHERRSGKRKVKSCIRGSAKALEAFAELGKDYWEHPTCKLLINYFLDRNGIYKRKNLEQYVNNDVTTLIFPFHWRAGILQILYSLSKMGYGKDERLVNAWGLLESKKDQTGKYPLDWTPNQSAWKVGKRGEANKWITFYSYLTLKYRDLD